MFIDRQKDQCSAMRVDTLNHSHGGEEELGAQTVNEIAPAKSNEQRMLMYSLQGYMKLMAIFWLFNGDLMGIYGGLMAFNGFGTGGFMGPNGIS